MRKPIYISPTVQYNIDMVRRIRHELGLSQRAVSRYLNPDTESNIVGNVESVKTSVGYSDHNLNILANAFSVYAKHLIDEMEVSVRTVSNIKTEYTIYDFYPNRPLDDIPQIKTKIDLPEGLSLTGVINAILETKQFLDVPHTVSEITDYCNSLSDGNWKSSNLTSTLDYAVKKGKLKKIERADRPIVYQKA